jgi:hypothetical protein
MHRRRYAAVGALLVAGFANAAAADWESTKWGMTADEVLASGLEKLVRTDEKFQEQSRSLISDGRSSALLAGWHTANGRKFLALFYFDVETKRLVSVNLDLRQMDEADSLFSQVTAQYGAPTTQTDVAPDFYSRSWIHDGDRIVFIRTPGTAKLNFFAE